MVSLNRQWGATPQLRAPNPYRSPEIDRRAGESRARIRVLIVEDEYFVATAAEAALVDAGYHVVDMAATADEAVALAERLRPDIVLMDIRLRAERDGIDAASAIRERFGIPTLFATAHGDSNTRRLGEAARPIGWLFKPYTPTQVVAAVQIAVRRMRG